MDAQEQYDALTPEQRARVDAILSPEVARGWIPRSADILAAIAAVLASDKP